MYIPSEKYKLASQTFSRNPKSKIKIDGIEYTGMDLIKVHPFISQEATKMIGEFPTKQCRITIFNRDNSIDVVDKEIEVYRGLVLDDNTIEYIPQGIFKPKSDDIKTNSTARTIEITMKDKSVEFDNIYGGIDNITYPTTLGDFINEIVTRHGMILETPTFVFHDLVLKERPNFDLQSTTERTLIAAAGALSGSTTQISRTGGVVISKPILTDQTIKKINYKRLSSKEKQYGPINSVVLGNKGINNDIVKKDEESISAVGLFEYKLYDNPYVDLNKEDMIDSIASEIIGMSIIPFELVDAIDHYLYDINDQIVIEDKEGNLFATTILKIESSSRIFTKLGASVQNNSQTDYNLAGSSKKSIEQIKFDVNHVKQEISAVAEKTDENSSQIAELNMTTEAIQQLVSGEYGMDREISSSKVIHIDDAMEYKPLDIKIYGYSQPYLAYYPGLDYLGLSYLISDKEVEVPKITLCVDKQDQNNPSDELKQIELNIVKPLRSLEDVKDELLISFNDKTEVLEATITRYLDYVDGRIVKLKTPSVESIPVTDFQLFEKTNYIYIKEDYNYGLYLRYLVYSKMNEFYATKIELKSAIKQTEESITLEVSKTYSTKEELVEVGTAFKQTTDEISSTVSKKVGENEVISKINQSSEKIEIDADKIGFKGKRINMDGTVFVNGVLNGTILNLTDDGTSQTAPITINYGNKKSTKVSSDGIEHYTDDYFFVLGEQQIQVPSGKVDIKVFRFGDYNNDSFFEIIMDKTGEYGSGLIFKNNGKILLDVSESNKVLTQRIIYDNESGTDGEVTLDIPLINGEGIQKIDIHYCDNNGKEHGTQTVDLPAGKFVTLTAQEVSGANSGYIRSSEYSIYSNKITPILTKCGYMRNLNGTWTISNNKNYLKITRVVAYFNN